MTYKVDLPVFSGPMDLLLDLIKKREMSIYEIEIHLLCDDFLEEIRRMEEINMEVTSDFIEMASLLLRIKSDSLLPKPPVEEDPEYEEEEDPRQALIDRLVEYDRVKRLSKALRERGSYEAQALYKPQEDFSYFSDQDLLDQCDLQGLVKSFYTIMQRVSRLEKAQEDLEKIPRPEFSFQEAREDIYLALEGRRSIYFSDLVMMDDRLEAWIAYFLVVLELVKNQVISALQEGMYEDIKLVLREG